MSAIIQKANQIIKEVIPVIEQAYSKNLPELHQIEVKTSSRMTRTFGHAQITTKEKKKLYIVKLSTFAFKEEHIDSKAFRNTVVHEIAHIAEALIYKNGMSHSSKWAKIMNVCGENASRFVTQDKKEEIDFIRPPKRVMKKYAHKCKAGCTHVLSGQKHNRLLRGTMFTCRKTGMILEKEFQIV